MNKPTETKERKKAAPKPKVKAPEPVEPQAAEATTNPSENRPVIGDLGILNSTWDNIAAAGLTSPEDYRNATDEQWEAIEGVSKKEIALIREEVGGPGDGEQVAQDDTVAAELTEEEKWRRADPNGDPNNPIYRLAPLGEKAIANLIQHVTPFLDDLRFASDERLVAAGIDVDGIKLIREVYGPYDALGVPQMPWPIQKANVEPADPSVDDALDLLAKMADEDGQPDTAESARNAKGAEPIPPAQSFAVDRNRKEEIFNNGKHRVRAVPLVGGAWWCHPDSYGGPSYRAEDEDAIYAGMPA